jgi:hypothetical protein
MRSPLREEVRLGACLSGACPDRSRGIRQGVVEGLILSSDRVILLD